MKKRKLLLISLGVLTLSLSTASCKMELLAPIANPGDGGGAPPPPTNPTPPPPPDESQKIATLKLYFANTSGVNVSDIVYDSNTDMFSRVGTTDTISFLNLAQFHYYSSLNNGGSIN